MKKLLEFLPSAKSVYIAYAIASMALIVAIFVKISSVNLDYVISLSTLGKVNATVGVLNERTHYLKELRKVNQFAINQIDYSIEELKSTKPPRYQKSIAALEAQKLSRQELTKSWLEEESSTSARINEILNEATRLFGTAANPKDYSGEFPLSLVP